MAVSPAHALRLGSPVPSSKLQLILANTKAIPITLSYGIVIFLFFPLNFKVGCFRVRFLKQCKHHREKNSPG